MRVLLRKYRIVQLNVRNRFNQVQLFVHSIYDFYVIQLNLHLPAILFFDHIKRILPQIIHETLQTILELFISIAKQMSKQNIRVHFFDVKLETFPRFKQNAAFVNRRTPDDIELLIIPVPF